MMPHATRSAEQLAACRLSVHCLFKLMGHCPSAVWDALMHSWHIQTCPVLQMERVKFFDHADSTSSSQRQQNSNLNFREYEVCPLLLPCLHAVLQGQAHRIDHWVQPLAMPCTHAHSHAQNQADG